MNIIKTQNFKMKAEIICQWLLKIDKIYLKKITKANTMPWFKDMDLAYYSQKFNIIFGLNLKTKVNT
ncbi:hypothetical protein CORI_0859 [Campylobacter sp. CCUG 57310]|nr:hypothetical protein CORI_0859 [Campylobacter sp. CCUG 57310]